jgi:hypothetical protein
MKSLLLLAGMLVRHQLIAIANLVTMVCILFTCFLQLRGFDPRVTCVFGNFSSLLLGASTVITIYELRRLR